MAERVPVLLVLLFFPSLLVTLNSFLHLPHQNTFHPPPPHTHGLAHSLRLCSGGERSQLLRGLQCYAIAQADGGWVALGEDVRGFGVCGGVKICIPALSSETTAMKQHEVIGSVGGGVSGGVHVG